MKCDWRCDKATAKSFRASLIYQHGVPQVLSSLRGWKQMTAVDDVLGAFAGSGGSHAVIGFR
jgi:hypothetical protein